MATVQREQRGGREPCRAQGDAFAPAVGQCPPPESGAAQRQELDRARPSADPSPRPAVVEKDAAVPAPGLGQRASMMGFANAAMGWAALTVTAGLAHAEEAKRGRTPHLPAIPPPPHPYHP